MGQIGFIIFLCNVTHVFHVGMAKTVGTTTFFFLEIRNYEFGFLKYVKIIFTPNLNAKQRHKSRLHGIISISYQHRLWLLPYSLKFKNF